MAVKTLEDVVIEAQALATIGEDKFEAALALLIADIQALPVADPTASIQETSASGIVREFIPKI